MAQSRRDGGIAGWTFSLAWICTRACRGMTEGRMRRKVVVTVSAMMVAAQLGSSVALAQPSVEQLGDIAELLSDNDVQGLRNYLRANPELAEGETTLARLLREFMTESADTSTYLGFRPELAERLREYEDGPAASTGTRPSTY